MWPVIQLGTISLPTYPLLVLVGLWAGMWLAARQATAFDGDHVYNAGFFGIIAGVLGARLWFVLSHWENYAPNIWQAFSLSRSALSVAEGVVVAALVMLVYVQRERIPVGRFADALAPGLLLLLTFTDLGTFLAGQSPGTPSSVPWAIDIAGTARHPVQVYQMGANLLILAALLTMRWQLWAGFQFWLAVGLYSLSRLLLEIFQDRPYLIGDGLLAVQVAALSAIIVSLAVMAYQFTKAESS